MGLRGLAVALALVSACSVGRPTGSPAPTATREPEALNVTVLLDLSGPLRGPSGAPQRDALQLWADQHSSGSPRLRTRIVDLAGSSPRAVLELRRAAVDERADAVIVGAPVDYDETFAAAVQLAQVPVLFTLPIREPATATGGWAFALAPTPAQLARATVDDAAARGVLGASLIVSDESGSAIPERSALVAELAKRGVTGSVVKVTAADVAAKLRPTLAATPSVAFAGWPRAYIDAARGAPTGTFLYFSYLCDAADIGELRDAAALATWPGSRWIAAPTISSAATPARAAFMQSYTERAGPPTTHAASAFDALTLLATAAEGGGDPARLRDRLQAGTFHGVATTYSFSASRRAGFALEDLAFLRYTGGRAAPAVR